MLFYVKKNSIYKNKVLSHSIDQQLITSHINSFTSSKLVNKDPSTDRNVYSVQNPYYNNYQGQFIRNPNCWLNGVTNISCFSPAQLSGAPWWQRGGTLITRKHVLFATHFVVGILPNGGTPLIFVDDNNNVIKRNIIEYGYDTNERDIAIALLDEEVPSNIKIAKVLPPNYTDFMTIAPSFAKLAVVLDQEEKAILKILTNLSSYDALGNGVIVQDVVINNIGALNNFYNDYINFSENIVVGDSGNPIFLIIDNELVVLSTFLTVTGGPFITNRYNEINNIIENLSPGGGYSLTPIDLEFVYHKYS